MNLHQALVFLKRYDPYGEFILSDVYDDEEVLREAIAAAFPTFEYPDWAHRTVRTLYRSLEDE